MTFFPLEMRINRFFSEISTGFEVPEHGVRGESLHWKYLELGGNNVGGWVAWIVVSGIWNWTLLCLERLHDADS